MTRVVIIIYRFLQDIPRFLEDLMDDYERWKRLNDPMLG
jgi:hypothetical protein